MRLQAAVFASLVLAVIIAACSGGDGRQPPGTPEGDGRSDVATDSAPKELSELVVGDCLSQRVQDQSEDLVQFAGVTTVPCDDEDATLEVNALMHFDEFRSYPGEEQVELEMAERCLANDPTSVTSLFPSPYSWERGERSAVCLKPLDGQQPPTQEATIAQATPTSPGVPDLNVNDDERAAAYVAELYGVEVSGLEEAREVISAVWFDVWDGLLTRIDNLGYEPFDVRPLCLPAAAYIDSDIRLSNITTFVELLAEETILVNWVQLVDEETQRIVDGTQAINVDSEWCRELESR